MTCSCGVVKVGGRATSSRNWNPDCATHGTESDWYQSPEQTEKREAFRQRTIDLQRQAREARQRVRGSQPHVVVLDEIPNTNPTESDTPS